MHTAERRLRAMINPFSTAFAEWWCHSSARFVMTRYGVPGLRLRRRSPDDMIFVLGQPRMSSAAATRSNQGGINDRASTRSTRPPAHTTVVDLGANGTHGGDQLSSPGHTRILR